MNSLENKKSVDLIEKKSYKALPEMKILFTGGGTGGHVFPILAIAREIKKKKLPSAVNLYFAGPCNELFDELFKKEGIEIKRIITGKIRRYSSISAFFQNVIDLFFKIPLGTIQAFFYIFFLSPDLLICKGGYGSFPVTVAAKILQVPIFLHESDITPGLVNKIFSRFALEIFVSFPKTDYFPPKKIILVGNPIRKSLLKIPSEKEIEEKINLIKKKPVILIIGGSQGSERINNLILGILPQLLSEFQVIHQCGSLNIKEVTLQTDFLIPKELKNNYYLFHFLMEEQLKCAYHLSDIVITRAGSSDIFEIAALGKPSVLIPIPESAQNHQVKNAYSYSDFGAGLVIEEKNITPHLFIEKITSLINNKPTMERMKRKAINFSRPRSAEIIAEYSFEFLKQYLER
jgi:UDP-N-acetylglucosamine--N-acetylmuramyl-(pentapeptide) pyrophosphoryl-undecaprenol N-acetylglucosamine transferase